MICERCGKPEATEAAEAQAAAMAPRAVREGVAVVTKRDALRWLREPADVRLGDVVRVTLVAAAVPDITAGFYCECA